MQTFNSLTGAYKRYFASVSHTSPAGAKMGKQLFFRQFLIGSAFVHEINITVSLSEDTSHIYTAEELLASPLPIKLIIAYSHIRQHKVEYTMLVSCRHLALFGLGVHSLTCNAIYSSF